MTKGKQKAKVKVVSQRGIKIGGKREMEIKKIFCSWRCFGKNPALATKILVNLVGVTVLRPFSPARMGYERGLEMPKGCLEDTRTLAIGAALLYSLAFVVAYSIIYLTYGHVWL